MSNAVLFFPSAFKEFGEIKHFYLQIAKIKPRAKLDNKTTLVIKTRLSLATDCLWWFIHKAATQGTSSKSRKRQLVPSALSLSKLGSFCKLCVLGCGHWHLWNRANQVNFCFSIQGPNFWTLAGDIKISSAGHDSSSWWTRGSIRSRKK